MRPTGNDRFLDPGQGSTDLVRSVTAFKRQLDHALVLKAQRHPEPAELAAADSWLTERGFVKQPSGKGVAGQHIIEWLFGPFWSHGSDHQLCQVPPWMCIGWNRRQRPKVSRDDALDIAERLDADTRAKQGEQAIGHWLKPFPLVLMAEGQNRIDMYTEHELPILMRLATGAVAPSHSLRLQRIFGCPHLVALHCDDETFHRRETTTALLPFPHLSVPLLEAYGVRWTRGSHVVTPWHHNLRDHDLPPWNDPLPWHVRWRPHAWPRMLLTQAYV